MNSWGHSSVGRAPAWHAGGQRFESAWLHKKYSSMNKINFDYLKTKFNSLTFFTLAICLWWHSFNYIFELNYY